MSMKLAVFWDISAWMLVNNDQRFTGVYSFQYLDGLRITVMMDAVSSSETSVNTYHSVVV
jgi:hypothetical protein